MPSPYQYGSRLTNVFGEGGADRLSGILGGVDQDALNSFNRGSNAWGMSDLAGLTRSGLFSGDNLSFLQGLRGSAPKPWEVFGQTDPRSVARGGGARRDIRRGNRQARRDMPGKVEDGNVVGPSVDPNYQNNLGGKDKMGSK